MPNPLAQSYPAHPVLRPTPTIHTPPPIPAACFKSDPSHPPAQAPPCPSLCSIPISENVSYHQPCCGMCTHAYAIKKSEAGQLWRRMRDFRYDNPCYGMMRATGNRYLTRFATEQSVRPRLRWVGLCRVESPLLTPLPPLPTPPFHP